MKRSGNSRGGTFAAALTVAVMLGFAGRASADSKPKFVYVTNSGVAYGQDTFQAYQIAATATCTSSPCATTISISGSLNLDLNTGQLLGTIFLTDPSDLASSPVAFMVHNPSGSPVNQYQFSNPYTSSRITLRFPLNSLPGAGSGGVLCTSVSSSGCSSISTITIDNADMTPSLRASTGGTTVTATISSGSLVATGSTQGSGTVSAYAIDSSTGALTLVPGSPFAAGSNPYSLTVDPSSRFVYVANRDSNNVSAYTVDATTGALTVVPGSPFATGFDPYFIAADPKGKFVYVVNQRSNTISAFSIDNETGALTQINGSPFGSQYGPKSVTVDPAGKFVYVTNGDGGTINAYSISAYTIDPSTGALNPVPGPTYYGGPGPIQTAVDPLGRFLYEAFQLNPWWGVASFSIQNTTGALTPIVGCHTPCGDSWPSALAVHPSGKFLYTTDSNSDYVSARTIDSVTGQLGLVPGSPTGDFGHDPIDPIIGPYATGVLPNSIALDPSGMFAYVANMGSNNISAYTINGTTGALAPVPGSPFAAGVGPSSVGIVSSPASVAFNKFKIDVNIDEDRKTSFRVYGFFTLGAGSDGIYPLSEPVELQVGSYSVTLPAGSFRERGRHQFEYEGRINDVEVRIHIYETKGKDHLFTAEAKGNILKGIKNPVAVGLTIGDDEGSVTVKADIDK
jgi:6-phosphogluconolactonase